MSFPSIRQCLIAAACVLGPIRCAAQTDPNGGPLYILFYGPPGTVTGIVPTSINRSLSVTGVALGDEPFGFVRDAGGTITSLALPPGCSRTFAKSINAQGAIAGDCHPFLDGGFVVSPQGAVTVFHCSGTEGTEAFGINAAGAVIGSCFVNNAAHAYVRSPEGAITLFDVPGSASTDAFTINAPGAIAGLYYDVKNVQHGFVRHPNGSFTLFDIPGIVDLPVLAGSGSSAALKLNAAGQITGSYIDANNVHHGFVRSAQGAVTSFDVAGSTQTYAQDINASGTITGSYRDAMNLRHGFVRAPHGKITTFDVPQKSDTDATSINDAGVIAGSVSTGHPFGNPGFLRVPGANEKDELQPGTYVVVDNHSLYVDGGFFLYGDPTVRLWIYVPGNPSQQWEFSEVSGGFTMFNRGTGQYASDGGGQLIESSLRDAWTVAPVSGGYIVKNNRTGLFLTDPAVQGGAVTLTTSGSVWQFRTPPQ